MLHQVGLYFHMLALLLVGGGNVALIVVERELWKKIAARSPNASVLIPLLEVAPIFIQAWTLLFLLSGITMLYSYNWIFLTQPWFISKISLFIMLPLRGFLIGKKTVDQIVFQFSRSQIPGDHDMDTLNKLQIKMRRFHLVQYALLAAIIFLVIFKI